MRTDIQFEDIKLAFLALFRRKRLIVIVAILGGLIGLLISSILPVQRIYSTTASVYSATYGSYEESVDGISAMNNYAGVVTSTKVCERAAASIGDASITASDIQKMISTNFDNESYILYIYAETTKSDVVAQEVANAVAQAFVEEITDITGYNSVKVLDDAQNVYIYNSTSRKKVCFVIFVCSIVLVCGYIGLKELFSDKVKSVEQCYEDDADEIIAIIPVVTEK